MTTPLRRLALADLDAVLQLRHLGFGDTVDDALRARTRERLERGELVGVDDGGLAAIARVMTADHGFGGRAVRCQHVGSVAVAPEHRGRGVASGMLRAIAAEGAAAGHALSVLYPATTPPYRRLGWEQAGVLAVYRLDARAVVGVRGPALRPATDEDRPAIARADEAAWRHTPGLVRRTATDWDRLAEGAAAYVLDAEDAGGESGGPLQAHLLYRPTSAPGDWQYTLDVAAWGATTPEGLRALLAFVGRHGSLGKDVELAGPVPHPWAFLTPEQDVRRVRGMEWMARGLDLAAAVAARGFPAGLGLDVTVRVSDPVLPEAEGPWRLDVADGAGRLEPVGSGEVRLDARAVGPLYTGFASAEQLAAAGLCDGPAHALARLSAAFAGPVPVLFDFF